MILPNPSLRLSGIRGPNLELTIASRQRLTVRWCERIKYPDIEGCVLSIMIPNIRSSHIQMYPSLRLDDLRDRCLPDRGWRDGST